MLDIGTLSGLDNKLKANMDIEQLLAHCGDFGRYQWMLLALFCLINILSSINYYSQTIITFVPEHW